MLVASYNQILQYENLSNVWSIISCSRSDLAISFPTAAKFFPCSSKTKMEIDPWRMLKSWISSKTNIISANLITEPDFKTLSVFCSDKEIDSRNNFYLERQISGNWKIETKQNRTTLQTIIHELRMANHRDEFTTSRSFYEEKSRRKRWWMTTSLSSGIYGVFFRGELSELYSWTIPFSYLTSSKSL